MNIQLHVTIKKNKKKQNKNKKETNNSPLKNQQRLQFYSNSS